jgi:hypothetical protein
MKKNNLSFTILKKVITIQFAILFSFVLISCDTDVNELPDPDDTSEITPKITSVDTPDSIWAGISEIVVNGQDFSPVLENNIVYFDGYSTSDASETFAVLLEATSTMLRVKVPYYVSDSVEVKVAVQGVENFNETTFLINIKAAVIEIFGDGDNLPSGITVDNSQNLYFNHNAFGVNEGLKRFSPSGVLENFAAKSGSFYIDLKYGRDGRVYGTRSPTVRAVFANADGGTPSAIAVANSAAKLISLDFDNNYNIWTGGVGGDVYRITEDASDKKPFPFEPEVKSLRFYDGYIYVAAKMDSTEAIYRMQVIDSDNIGAAEVYFDVTANIAPYSVNAITFSSDGKMFLGTDAEGDDPNALIVVNTDGSFNTWYPRVITGPILAFAWDTGDYLYYVRGLVGDTQVQKNYAN